jgi:hypothetical protein
VRPVTRTSLIRADEQSLRQTGSRHYLIAGPFHAQTSVLHAQSKTKQGLRPKDQADQRIRRQAIAAANRLHGED